MDIFWGSNLLVEPINKNTMVVKSTQTIPASDLNLHNGDVLGFILVDGGTASYGGRIHIGNVTVTNSSEDLVCTVGAYNGQTSIQGLGFFEVRTNMSFIPQAGGAFPGIFGLGAGSSSGVADGPNTGKQGSSLNTGVIILFY